MQDAIDDGRFGKLRFRAWRRGFREADLILGPFADTHVRSLTPSQLDDFETLLDQPDHDLLRLDHRPAAHALAIRRRGDGPDQELPL
jgi:succinate dehydrogenase flavin-adding protein (antitoxin of CptAB toxin-antitoxin module)